MPNTREKLIELLEEAEGLVNNDVPSLEQIADHLIASGVTIQTADKPTAVDYNLSPTEKWIPVTERLPEHGDVVLCFMKFGKQHILQWDNVSSWWLGYGHGDDWQKADVTHWCCLPQPPKGE